MKSIFNSVNYPVFLIFLPNISDSVILRIIWSEVFSVTHKQIYIPANSIFRIMVYIIWKWAVWKTLSQILRKVLSYHVKSYAPMNTKWQKIIYLICCLNLLLTECKGFLERFMLYYMRISLRAIWTKPEKHNFPLQRFLTVQPLDRLNTPPLAVL